MHKPSFFMKLIFLLLCVLFPCSSCVPNTSPSSLRSKPFYTPCAKYLLGEYRMTMLIKFKLFDYPYLPFKREIKLKFEEKEYSTGEIVECPAYKSWSGLTWSKCYYYLHDGEIQEFRGIVKKTFTVLKLDLYRKEVKMDVDEFKKYHIGLLEEVRKIIAEGWPLMLKTTEMHAEIFCYTLYDLRVTGILVGRQANLLIYYLVFGKRMKERLMESLKLSKAEKVEVSQHQIFFNKTVYYTMDKVYTSRVRLTALLALSDFTPCTTLIVCHPEHGVEKVTLEGLPRTHGLLIVHEESRE